MAEAGKQVREAGRAHRRLSDRYRAPLMAYFKRRTGDPVEAEDLAQEVLVKIMEMPDFARVEKPENFIFRTAANLLVDRARKTAVRQGAKADLEVLGAGAEVFTPERVIQSRQELRHAIAALDALPDTTRDIFMLHRHEGFKYREIADLYGMSQSAVEKHMAKALARVMKTVKL